MRVASPAAVAMVVGIGTMPRVQPPSMVAPTPVADGSLAVDSTWDYNAFLSGFQNSAEVEASEVPCSELPRDLVGTYYRNGHARFVGRDGRKVRHPFDADGMLCAVSLDGRSGKAVVRQRYVATDGALKERAAGKSLFPGQFGNPLPFWKGGAEFKNLANTGVMWHGGKLLALWEGSRPHIIDPLSLATVAEWDVDGMVGTGATDSFSAHPRDTPEGGKANFAFFGIPGTGWTTVRFWDFLPDSFQLRFPAQVHELPGMGLYHDFLVTKNWFILTAAPTTWGRGGWHSFWGTLEWIAGKRTVVSMIAFDETKPTVVHFFPRNPSSGAQLVAVPLDTFSSFHHANAYEDPDTGEVVFDTVRSDRLVVEEGALAIDSSKAGENRFILEDMDLEKDMERVTLTRYTVDLATGSFSKQPLSSRHVEFPSVAPVVRGMKHRYVFCSAAAKAEIVSPYSGVLKVDADDPSRSQVWLPEPHQFCGEPIFQPREGASAEDDGYLLTLCYDGKQGSSTLLVLDAKHVDRGPVARVPIPDKLESGIADGAAIGGPGHGLHGTWAPGLAPSLTEVREAERKHASIPARFLTDGTPN